MGEPWQDVRLPDDLKQPVDELGEAPHAESDAPGDWPRRQVVDATPPPVATPDPVGEEGLPWPWREIFSPPVSTPVAPPVPPSAPEAGASGRPPVTVVRRDAFPEEDEWQPDDDAMSREWEATGAESLEGRDERSRVSSGHRRLAATVQTTVAREGDRAGWDLAARRGERSGSPAEPPDRREGTRPLFEEISLEQAMLLTQVLGRPRALQPYRPPSFRDPA